MKKIFTVVIFAFVLGICGPSFGNDEVERYQAIPMVQIATLILVDTVTGQAWHCFVNPAAWKAGETPVCHPLNYKAGPDELSLFPSKGKKAIKPDKELRH